MTAADMTEMTPVIDKIKVNYWKSSRRDQMPSCVGRQPDTYQLPRASTSSGVLASRARYYKGGLAVV